MFKWNLFPGLEYNMLLHFILGMNFSTKSVQILFFDEAAAGCASKIWSWVVTGDCGACADLPKWLAFSRNSNREHIVLHV